LMKKWSGSREQLMPRLCKTTRLLGKSLSGLRLPALEPHALGKFITSLLTVCACIRARSITNTLLSIFLSHFRSPFLLVVAAEPPRGHCSASRRRQPLQCALREHHRGTASVPLLRTRSALTSLSRILCSHSSLRSDKGSFQRTTGEQSCSCCPQLDPA
jgi:hypothetical protein